MLRLSRILDLDIVRLAEVISIGKEMRRAVLLLRLAARIDGAFGLRVEPVDGFGAGAAAGLPALGSGAVDGKEVGCAAVRVTLALGLCIL